MNGTLEEHKKVHHIFNKIREMTSFWSQRNALSIKEKLTTLDW
jgi:hypothetical protein